jgi:hypothetical protein
MTPEKRKVGIGLRLLLLVEGVATIAAIVMLATVWPVRAVVVVVAIALAVLALRGQAVAGFIHRLTGH